MPSISKSLLSFAVALAACSSNSDSPGDLDGGGVREDAASERADAGPPPRPDAAPPPQNCDSLPAIPVDVQTRDWIASEDFTFDAEGNLWGVSTNDQALHKIDESGSRVVVAPNVSSWGRGIRFVADNHVVVANPDSGQLLRFSPNGQSIPLATDLGDVNGLAVHIDGQLFLTTGSATLYKIDPESGAKTLIPSPPGVSLDGIAFNRDYSSLFFNTEGGIVYRIAIDENANPVGEYEEFVSLPKIEILDGMTVDDCDNLYVVEMSGIVWRVSPNGDTAKAVDLREGDGKFGAFFISAANFGSGVGGWKKDSLYIMSLDGALLEAPLGVASKPVFHLP